MRERRLVREEHLMAHGRQIAEQNLGAFLAWVVGNADLDSQTQRENGVARLDGTRPCATVARKVMESGDPATAVLVCRHARKRSAQA